MTEEDEVEDDEEIDKVINDEGLVNIWLTDVVVCIDVMVSVCPTSEVRLGEVVGLGAELRELRVPK